MRGGGTTAIAFRTLRTTGSEAAVQEYFHLHAAVLRAPLGSFIRGYRI